MFVLLTNQPLSILNRPDPNTHMHDIHVADALQQNEWGLMCVLSCSPLGRMKIPTNVFLFRLEVHFCLLNLT